MNFGNDMKVLNENSKKIETNFLIGIENQNSSNIEKLWGSYVKINNYILYSIFCKKKKKKIEKMFIFLKKN